MSDARGGLTASETDIAVVGMAGRFPGAPDPDALWRRVVAGDDCLTDLGEDELLASGVPRRVFDDPAYVRRAGLIDDVERFDASFFGIGARDAAVMDPQHRHFLECAWSALESAAIVPSRFDGAIGVFAGSGMNTYLINNLLADPRLRDELGWFLLRHTGNDKDFLTTEVSYRLDLRGPSINVQTACSTSLVAVHLAVQSLLALECDAALAGGVTIEVPQRVGHLHQEGEILSADGRCRAFDAASTGTVLTSGVGAVVLRRLADAVEDGDPVLAVIKGTAVNNDGSRKVSFLAPSVEGHAEVVREALAVAGLTADDLQFLETHGTGTALGDPIEVAALAEAFADAPAGRCRLGSTKPNVGHLDTAAGVVSLIKVVQALRHRTLPPMANHTAPSELIPWAGSPFVLSDRADPWPGHTVRRAGVSSLGVGGTNAHVVVEEAPPALERVAPDLAAPHLLVVSARSDDSLVAGAAALADALAVDDPPALVDVARTLAVGRSAFPRRSAVVAVDARDAADQLRALRPPRHEPTSEPIRAVFLFPGGGSQYVAMGSGLAGRMGAFTRTRAQVVEAIRAAGGVDLDPLLAPGADASVLDAPTVALPAVFATTLAMAAQWGEWGVEPDAMLGHSLGEYAAAHLAGVLTLDDAVRLVVVRAQLMERVGGPGAAMLVVPLDEASVQRHLGPDVSLAVVNAADEVVLAGAAASIDRVAVTLAAEGVESSRVHLAAAAHSVLLDPVLEEFRRVATTIRFAPPQKPYVSNLSGTWITDEEATDPEYWVNHLRGTVRFAECLATACADGPTVTIEIGPGHALSATARRSTLAPLSAVASMRHPRRDVDDEVAALEAVGDAWAAGVAIDPHRVATGTGRRITLPTYAFTGDRHWIEPAVPSGQGSVVAENPEPALARISDPAEMWWERIWVESPPPAVAPPRRWWLVADRSDRRTAELCEEINGAGHDIAGVVEPGGGLDLRDGDGVVLLGSGQVADPGSDDVSTARRRWLFDAPELVRALGSGRTTGHRLVLVADGATALDGPAPRPAEALSRGVGLVAAREYPDVEIRLIDVEGAATPALGREIVGSGGDPFVVAAGAQRLTPELVATATRSATPDRLPDGARVLITGGLGGVGSALAAALARRGVRLAVTTGSALPLTEDRDRWRAEHGPRDRTTVRLDRLDELTSTGATVEVVVGDVADRDDTARAVTEAAERLGGLDAVIHAAGVLRDAPIELLDPAAVDAVLGARVVGALSIIEAAKALGVPTVCLVSSTSTEIAPAGQVAYVAASAVLDELAGTHDRVDVVTLGSGMWSGVGMAAEFARRSRLGLGIGEPLSHPVFEEVVRDPHHRDAVDVVGHLDASLHWQVGDHRDLAGDPVLPGTGHLWLLLDAVRLVSGDACVELRDLMLHERLLVPDGDAVLVRVRIEGDRDGSGGARRVSLDSDGGDAGWIRHSSADVFDHRSPGAPVSRRPRSDPHESVDPFAGQREHLHLGDHWPSAVSASIEGEHAVGEVVASDGAAVSVDVAALDAATGLAVQVLRTVDPDPRLWVPIGYRLVRWTGPLVGTAEVNVARVDPTGSLFDVALVDAAGTESIRIEGLELWPVDAVRLGEGDVDREVGPAGGALGALADADGITAEEGGILLDALLADGRPRLIASTVDLPSLVARALVPVLAPTPVAGEPDSVGDSTLDTVGLAWAALLGVAEVDPSDDFFELGGHSLVAIRLLARIKRALGVELALSELLAAPTLAEMAALVEERRSGDGGDGGPQPVIVDFGNDAPGLPIHVVHGAGGGVMFLWALARALSGSRRIVGLQAWGLDGREPPDASIDAMADRYVAALVDAGPGPYVLAGYSGGGLVALEMASRLRARGELVLTVMLLDSVPPGRTDPRRPRRLQSFLDHLAHGRWGGVWPYARAVASNGFRRPPLVNHVDEGYQVDLFVHFSSVAERHRLGTYGGRIDLFKADRVWPTQPWDYYWGPHVSGELHVSSVPGDHFSMFSPDLVGALADAVRHAADVVDP